MSDSASPRTVQCYHCRRHFDVPPRAMSISCPWCSKRVSLDDVIISGTCWTSRIQTCGRVIVKKRSELVCSLVEASGGVEVHGYVESAIVSNGLVYVGPKARVKGDLRAPSIHVEPGGALDGGYCRIASEKAPAGPSRPPAGHAPILRPEHALVRVMPWLRVLKPV